jgi:hypothetical protein
VEELTVAEDSGSVYTALGYRRGSDFWADGANVPYNYTSGYVDGLLGAGPGDAATVALALELMEPLLRGEDIATVDSWPYWWARGREGWSASESISLNTPDYAGFVGVAHITYRSMDAAAVLRLRDAQVGSVPNEVVANLARLVAGGQLLPWVQERLPDTMKQPLAERVAYRYARSAAPWEFQSQVWALNQLAAQQND